MISRIAYRLKQQVLTKPELDIIIAKSWNQKMLGYRVASAAAKSVRHYRCEARHSAIGIKLETYTNNKLSR